MWNWTVSLLVDGVVAVFLVVVVAAGRGWIGIWGESCLCCPLRSVRPLVDAIVAGVFLVVVLGGGWLGIWGDLCCLLRMGEGRGGGRPAGDGEPQ